MSYAIFGYLVPPSMVGETIANAAGRALAARTGADDLRPYQPTDTILDGTQPLHSITRVG
jgi:hypothetical protein